jgi:hypothetical protein
MLTWDVPFQSQPTHFVTWVDREIFDGIALFHQNKHCFVAYDKLFLEKSLTAIPYSEAYSFVSMKKKLA